jgi:hypothetical protein
MRFWICAACCGASLAAVVKASAAATVLSATALSPSSSFRACFAARNFRHSHSKGQSFCRRYRPRPARPQRCKGRQRVVRRIISFLHREPVANVAWVFLRTPHCVASGVISLRYSMSVPLARGLDFGLHRGSRAGECPFRRGPTSALPDASRWAPASATRPER